MKISILFLVLSFAANATYFIEKTLTSMTIEMGKVTSYYINGQEVQLRPGEQEIIGQFQHRCGEMGSVDSPQCQLYYQTREEIIIHTKGYLVRNHIRYLLDADEMNLLNKQRACRDFNWTIRALNPSELKAETRNTIETRKNECNTVTTQWEQVKLHGGKRSPDVVETQSSSIWDQAKDFLFGKEEAPTDAPKENPESVETH